MLRNLIGVFMLHLAQEISAQAAQECMKVSDEVGAIDKVTGV